MKTKKVFLPLALLGLLSSVGLAACTSSGSTSKGGESSQSEPISQGEEEKIVISSAAKEVAAGETLQLTASVEGVTWESKDETILTVSSTGLVTGVKVGSTRVTAKKDGYQTGSISISVTKAPEKEAKVTLHMEDADHFSPNDDKWGMNYGGQWYGPNADGDSPIEESSGSDGTSLGWLQTGCKETLTFTSDKAVKVEIGVSMAYNADVDLGAALKVTFNGKEISTSGLVCPGPEDGDSNNYYDFSTVSFGQVDLLVGNNVLVIEMLAQGPNMDDFKVFTNENVTITVVKPTQKETIVVTPDTVEIEAESTQQLTTATAGVTYTSADEKVATVSETGLITGVKAGKTTITVSKDGMKSAKVNVQVNRKAVANEIVLEAEDAILPEGSPIQLEDAAAGSGGKSIGYFSAGATFSLEYTAEKAEEVSLTLVAAAVNMKADYSGIDDMDLAAAMTLKLNGTAISLEGKVLPGISGWNFQNWAEIDLGKVNLVEGKNTFEFEAVAQGPNIDCLRLVGEASGDIKKSTQVDLSQAYFLEFEDADLAGGAREETNAAAHGGKSVGYFAEGASASFAFAAEAAGTAKLLLIGHSDLGENDWHQNESGTWVQTNIDHPILDCLKIAVNGAEMNLPANAGYLGEDGITYVQIDLGNINLVAGKNTIVVSATAQGPNFDAIALVSQTKLSAYVEPLPQGMISVEFEDGEFTRPEGNDETNALVVDASNKKASGGENVGYVVAGSKVSLRFNASAAGKVGLSFIGASTATSGNWWSQNMADQALADCITLKVNGVAVDLTGKVLPGTSGSNYYNWATLDLGQIDVTQGINEIVVEATAQGPNLDCLRIQGTDAVTVTLVLVA